MGGDWRDDRIGSALGGVNPDLVGHPVWLYPAENWHDPASALGPEHEALREAIGHELDVLSAPAAGADGAE
ncbi:hypothetical protein [Kitasatospora sp. NPDC096204]|uniref:hypothetical protein n=1 Tax=Kitasatospora sp. NPDC096204 TaxID=3364094 RepID=UPI00382CEA5B